MTEFYIVGVTGGAGHGKGTVASVLVDCCGFAEVALADPLKGDLERWFPPEEFPEFSRERQSARDRDPVVRRFQQVYGTEIVRRIEGPKAWVRRLADRILLVRGEGKPGVVVPDVRFPNDEAVAIKRWGGTLVHVERPGYVEPTIKVAHCSEAYLVNLRNMADVVLENDGTEEELLRRVESLTRERGWMGWTEL